jgi:hypothetical protein
MVKTYRIRFKMNLKSVARDTMPSTWKTEKQNKLQTTNLEPNLLQERTTLKGETGDLGRREEDIHFSRLLPIPTVGEREIESACWWRVSQRDSGRN